MSVGPSAATAVTTGTLVIDRRLLSVWACRLALLAGILGLWQWAGSRSQYSQIVYSTPTRIADQLSHWVTQSHFWSDLGVTLEEAAAGYLFGVLVAVAMIAIVVPNPVVSQLLAPFIAAANAVPKVALAPLFILWFGLTLKAKVVYITCFIAFVMFYRIAFALEGIDRQLIANTRVLGARRLEMLRHVYVPATLGAIVTSLRIASAWSLVGAVIGEYLGANRGLGYAIAAAQQGFQTDVAIAGLVVIALIAVMLDRALVWAEAALSRWRVPA